MTVDIGACFHPAGRTDAVYQVVGVRANGPGGCHVLLVAAGSDQNALAVPLPTLTDRRYWLPAT